MQVSHSNFEEEFLFKKSFSPPTNLGKCPLLLVFFLKKKASKLQGLNKKKPNKQELEGNNVSECEYYTKIINATKIHVVKLLCQYIRN